MPDETNDPRADISDSQQALRRAQQEETVRRAKLEILRDIREGIVPKDIASFSDLHNYVDANYYGAAFDPDAPHTSFSNDDDINFWNNVQGAVDEWIKRLGSPSALVCNPDPARASLSSATCSRLNHWKPSAERGARLALREGVTRTKFKREPIGNAPAELVQDASDHAELVHDPEREKLKASVRVMSSELSRTNGRASASAGAELLTIKANGRVAGLVPEYPVSLHMSVPPKLEGIPSVGDHVQITIEPDPDYNVSHGEFEIDTSSGPITVVDKDGRVLLHTVPVDKVPGYVGPLPTTTAAESIRVWPSKD